MLFTEQLLEEQDIRLERRLILLRRVPSANRQEVVFCFEAVAPKRQRQSEEDSTDEVIRRASVHSQSPLILNQSEPHRQMPQNRRFNTREVRMSRREVPNQRF